MGLIVREVSTAEVGITKAIAAFSRWGDAVRNDASWNDVLLEPECWDVETVDYIL